MRGRVTFPDDLLSRAKQYAKDTNRTFSELVCEALEQIIARYPKRHHEAKTDLDALADEVYKRIALRYPQVLPRAKGA